MIFGNLPPTLRLLLLSAIGAIAGSIINWAIYQLAFFRQRTISPWQQPDEKASQRSFSDFIPVIGWWRLRRERELHGKGFWLRPLLIELIWLIGLPLFYQWQMNGGLTGDNNLIGWTSHQAEFWFIVHSVLIGLMFVATFIDFDEKMIPDGVTVTGTLFALTMATLLPSVRLPQVVTKPAGLAMEAIHFNSPLDLTVWQHGWLGLAAALGIFTFWIFALLPKTFWWRNGILSMFRFMTASIVRPARKTTCKIRVLNRQTEPLTTTLSFIWLIGMVLIPVAWFATAGMTNWTSLIGSLVGLFVAGILVWAIRIIGSWAMGQEAMGFGDVTLMFMIGAFLGWQAAVLTFILSPFAALAITFFHFVISRKSEIAFGPYLCLGGMVVILNWSRIWPPTANSFFNVGLGWLSIVVGGALILMPMMLYVLLLLKGEPDQQDE